MVEIKEAINGWILTTRYDEDGVEQSRVFSYDDDKSAAMAFRDLIYAVKDIVGPSDSRYSEHRVYVVIKPGDKNDKFTEQDSIAIWGDVTEL